MGSDSRIRKRLGEIEDRKIEILLELGSTNERYDETVSRLDSEYRRLDDEYLRLRMELMRTK
jgi:hypothetical protein